MTHPDLSYEHIAIFEMLSRLEAAELVITRQQHQLDDALALNRSLRRRVDALENIIAQRRGAANG